MAKVQPGEVVPEQYGKLRIAHVDVGTYTINVSTTLPESERMEAMELLNTEDAKLLALRHAVRLGWTSPTLKNHAIVFGDPSKRLISQRLTAEEMKNGIPFLSVEIYVSGADQFAAIGDALVEG